MFNKKRKKYTEREEKFLRKGRENQNKDMT